MSANTPSTQFQERRHSHKLRVLYPDANEHLHEVFRRYPVWGGTSVDFIALRAIHERYRGLTSQEVRILVKAAARLHCIPVTVTELVA